eukprot:1783654-Prymnesium_polylepis.2
MRLIERCGAASSGARHGNLVYLGASARAGWRTVAEHVVRVPDWAIPTPADRFGRRLRFVCVCVTGRRDVCACGVDNSCAHAARCGCGACTATGLSAAPHVYTMLINYGSVSGQCTMEIATPRAPRVCRGESS